VPGRPPCDTPTTRSVRHQLGGRSH